MDFKVKVIIVTAAGGGIGEDYAKRFAKEGMKVAIAELNDEQAQRVGDEINADGGQFMRV